MRETPLRKEWLLRLTTIAGGLLIGLVLTEVLLRAVGFSYPRFYRVDPVLGRANIPGATGWFTDEGNAYVEINSDGMRDREHSLDKPAGTIRIAVLGDSFAAALQVPTDQTFWGQLEPDLASCPARRDHPIEVLNFGVVGYGTGQEYLMLQTRVWKYHPDIVLLAFLTANDIADNAWTLKQSNNTPYFVHRDGKLVEDPSFGERNNTSPPGALDRLWDAAYPHLRLLQAWMKGKQEIELMANSGKSQAAVTVPGQEPGLYEAVYRPPDDPVWQEAWSVTEDLIKAMATSARAHGATFVIATLSNGIQVHPDPAVRQKYAERFNVTDFFYPDRRIEALAASEGVPFVMLAPAIRDWAEAHHTCVHGFDNGLPCAGHWNEAGHRLAGELIADKLCRDVLPTLPAPRR